ncbi:RNA polymerase recycling motor HelD [uncultured Clostridium sp.]|uniref:RNA polymerase recycling motor HelD n=1 Tax=uncultured Clostridium sp. TaxID=59620 RepID=UPI0025E5DFFF|nr:RNA polymerase recycling motor HelD [uncultured Clostridium sp.]
MSRQIDFLMEENKLEEIQGILHNEVLKYLNRRKVVTGQILEARQKYIEEYKDDEDQVIDYFDHENYVKEEAYKTIDKRLMEFTKLKESPYFGKVTFKEEDSLPEDIYIGRYGLTLEDAFEPLIVDWRAPIASLFYKGTVGPSSYNPPSGEIKADILSRKQLIIKKGELKGVFDSALDVKDEILQMVLTSNSSEKLKDIVMTIQKEQDEIIREDRNKIVVVNGVAGSGKTTIALHRVSYLLYNFRKQFGDKVLIFGPNDIFMDYIAQVLPTLGESGGINQTTFENFAKKELNLDNIKIKGFGKYIEDAMNNNAESLEEYKYKSSRKFTDVLNSKINELDKNYFEIKPVIFNGEEIVSVEEIEELFNVYYKDMPLFRRSEKIRRILTSKIKDKRDETVYKLNAEIKEKAQNLSEAEADIEKNNLEFLRRIKIREIVREVMNSRSVLDKWLKAEPVLDIYKRIINGENISKPVDDENDVIDLDSLEDNNNLGYMDLAGILYLMVKLEGIKVKNEIKHIVIDEAQDYSYMQFEIIKEMTNCKSYTIVGDSNQRLINTEDEPAMLHLDEVFGNLKTEIKHYDLSKSYRSTQQIMEYANKFLSEEHIVPLVRKGEPVIEEEVDNKEDCIDTILSLIDDYEEDGYENIAVIFNSTHELEEYAPILKEKIGIQNLDNEEILYKGGRVLIPAYLAKGLEFDGAIIVESEHVQPLVKYIMCTRALHRLSVIKNI